MMSNNVKSSIRRLRMAGIHLVSMTNMSRLRMNQNRKRSMMRISYDWRSSTSFI